MYCTRNTPQFNVIQKTDLNGITKNDEIKHELRK